MKLLNRESLIDLFKDGKRPSEKHFEDLINSTINKLDDGIKKDFENGLELAPLKAKTKVISLYSNIEQVDASWSFHLSKEDELGIISKEEKGVKILSNGFVGVNKKPEYTLDVDGTIATKQRVGNFANDTVDANGKWHTILEGLSGCQIFEITACAKGEKNKGNYALLYALAINAYKGKGGRIKYFQNSYKWWFFWEKIQLRWLGNPFDYKLQIKTGTDYGKNAKIEYQVTKLYGSSKKVQD